ncbi:MAG: rhodanese-like domain-containing protein [Cyclobacteriaceae bacterium]|nr:rhodanese-like domain-containing protein [Cyclobacteriaceae bacterium]
MNNMKKVVVDVRTPQEFAGGHIPESINIPMQEVMQRLDEFKGMNQPILLCCASGNRSGQVAAYLNSIGIQCENGGCWMEINATHSTY